MTASSDLGERAAEQLLIYEGWQIIERQHQIHGHRIDLLAKHPVFGEWLVEVKVWARGGGKDTVKKAIADAYHLRHAGSDKPYMLVLSHDLGGVNGDMLRAAVADGAIHRIRVLAFTEFS